MNKEQKELRKFALKVFMFIGLVITIFVLSGSKINTNNLRYFKLAGTNESIE